MKRVRFIARHSFRFLLGLVLVYLTGSVVLSFITIDPEEKDALPVSIFVVSNGVHTDLVVPVRNEIMDWSHIIRFEHTKARDSSRKWVSFGWGAKGFYLETPAWSDLKASTAFKAAFSLGTTAMHTQFHNRLKENDHCVAIRLHPDQYRKLVAFISGSFQKDSTGFVIPISTNAVYGKHDAFYEALGSYSMLKTCNTWTNEALKSAGLKACLWTPWDKGILYQYGRPLW